MTIRLLSVRQWVFLVSLLGIGRLTAMDFNETSPRYESLFNEPSKDKTVECWLKVGANCPPGAMYSTSSSVRIGALIGWKSAQTAPCV